MYMATNYKADFQHEKDLLTELLREQEALKTRIAKQQMRLAALATLASEQDAQEEKKMETNYTLGEGLTNACRTAFRAAGSRGLMPTEVRSALEQLRFPTRDYRNILSSIYTVIKRLVEKGEIRPAIIDMYEGQDKSVYVWMGPVYGAPGSLANMLADHKSDRSPSKRR
jgi:hypothetical protein